MLIWGDLIYKYWSVFFYADVKHLELCYEWKLTWLDFKGLLFTVGQAQVL